MSETPPTNDGGHLLLAVERLLASDETILRRADDCVSAARASGAASEGAEGREASRIAISGAANLAAVAGAVTALPSVVPGLGSLFTLTAGALADAAALLKIEVELALTLAWIHGFDIRTPDERRLAFLLAAVETHDAKAGGSVLEDLARAEGAAIRAYGAREVSRLLALVMTRLALVFAGKNLLRAIPLVGVVVGGGMNKVLTERAGERMRESLERRRRQRASPATAPEVVVSASERPAAAPDGTRPKA